MIERQNWQDVKAFIAYQETVEQKDVETIRNYWVALRHLLQWADDLAFPNAYKKENPPFSTYLLTARNDGINQPDKIGKSLAYAMQSKICTTARMFFRWARMEYPTRYKSARESWVATIQPSRRAARDTASLKKVEAWTLEDVLKVADLTDDNLKIARLEGLNLEKLSSRLDLSLLRAQAAICFLFLSGMRVTAFLSLPVSCVDLEKMIVIQDPSKGVLTKFRKAAITTFLPIPELLEVVKRWDLIVRKDAPAGRRWYCGVNVWGTALKDDGFLEPSKMRAKRNPLVDSMKKICALAGVPYKSPHKLRHGHAVWGVKHARTIAELKAVSQNLMHESIEITDGIYGNLTGEDTRKIISGLTGQDQKPQDDIAELLQNPAVKAFINAISQKA